MTAPSRKPATYEDLLKVPDNLVAEILGGELHTHPRPAPRHVIAASRLGTSLGEPFDFGRNGPGGWVFAVEPELHLNSHVVVPDLAGWRRERMPRLPDTAYFETAPDWVCEILSPSTAHVDRGIKRRIYADAGVPYLWLLDPDQRTLEIFVLAAGKWMLAATIVGAEDVSAPPFDAISFPLSVLFPFDAPQGAEPSQG